MTRWRPLKDGLDEQLEFAIKRLGNVIFVPCMSVVETFNSFSTH